MAQDSLKLGDHPFSTFPQWKHYIIGEFSVHDFFYEPLNLLQK